MDRLADHLSFNPIRELLNPKFESYKLSPTNDRSSAIHTLPGQGVHLRTLPDHARLSYAEVQARVRHNHLSAGLNGEVIYVDGDLRVTAVIASEVSRTQSPTVIYGGLITFSTFDQTGEPIFHPLLELPQPLSTSTSSRLPEYPTAHAISGGGWAISDGFGSLYYVSVDMSTSKWSGRIGGKFELETSSGGTLAPFRFHRVDVLPSAEILALLSTVEKIAPSAAPSLVGTGGLSTSIRTKIQSTTVFDFVVVKLSLPSPSPSSATDVVTMKLLPIWTLRSQDLPSYISFDSTSARYIISTSSGLFHIDDTPTPTIVPSRPVSNSVDSTSSSVPLPATLPVHKPPPFSWTQERSSLTVVFALPSSTPTSSIRVTFSRQFLTVHIGTAASALNPAPASVHSLVLPRVSHKKLWDAIDPYTSVWTFDREAEGRDSTFGLLSLHLEKKNAGTRWSEVFASSDAMDTEETGGIRTGDVGAEEGGKELEGVEETLDPSELAAIAESMEQWTNGVSDADGGGVGADNEGMGTGLPSSLMGEEIDVEVDGDSGRPIVITWVENILSSKPKLIRSHPTIPYSLLSIPLPCSSTSSPSIEASIVIQHDVDGLLFNPPISPSSSTQWTHTSTFPALAFVLATKRDASFVYHLSSKAVFAFDSPSNLSISNTVGSATSTRAGAGNLFTYHNTKEIKDKVGRQSVVRIGGSSSGNLLGVVGVEKAGKILLLALCEKELVVINVME